MSRLTVSDRERIERALVAALTPDDASLKSLQQVAYDAVFADYYGAKTLKLFAAMPGEWFDRSITSVYIKPNGGQHYRALLGPEMRVPRTPSGDTLGESAQKAVDAWAAAQDAQKKAERDAKFRVGAILNRVATLDGLLKLLPEARDILALPAPQAPDEVAAKINAALAARKAPPAPAPKAAVKPAAKSAKKLTRPAKPAA
jgi:hypothetical protein